MSPGENYAAARMTVMESVILIQQQLANTSGLEFTAAALARHHAAMTKIQMHARQIVEAAIDAEVECSIEEPKA